MTTLIETSPGLAPNASRYQVTEAEQIAHLSFSLGGHMYAVNLLQIREVRTIPKLTRVAHAPAYVLGVTSIRGEIIPVLDLKERFSLPRDEADSERALCIVSEIEQRRIGIRVDSVHDVISFSEAGIQPIPKSTMVIDIKYLRGMVQHDGQVVLLVDLVKVLDPQELHAVQVARSQAVQEAGQEVVQEVKQA